jgi:DNA-binding response OmpR family regulator
MDVDPILYGTESQREIRGLRERIGELEEENRQLKSALRPSVCFPATWKLWPREAKLLATLYASPGCVTYESLRLAMVGTRSDAPEDIVQVYLCRMRPKVGPLGIEIRVVRGTGLVLQPESRAIITKAVAAVASGDLV